MAWKHNGRWPASRALSYAWQIKKQCGIHARMHFVFRTYLFRQIKYGGQGKQAPHNDDCHGESRQFHDLPIRCADAATPFPLAHILIPE